MVYTCIIEFYIAQYHGRDPWSGIGINSYIWHSLRLSIGCRAFNNVSSLGLWWWYLSVYIKFSIHQTLQCDNVHSKISDVLAAKITWLSLFTVPPVDISKCSLGFCIHRKVSDL